MTNHKYNYIKNINLIGLLLIFICLLLLCDEVRHIVVFIVVVVVGMMYAYLYWCDLIDTSIAYEVFVLLNRTKGMKMRQNGHS